MNQWSILDVIVIYTWKYFHSQIDWFEYFDREIFKGKKYYCLKSQKLWSQWNAELCKQGGSVMPWVVSTVHIVCVSGVSVSYKVWNQALTNKNSPTQLQLTVHYQPAQLLFQISEILCFNSIFNLSDSVIYFTGFITVKNDMRCGIVWS